MFPGRSCLSHEKISQLKTSPLLLYVALIQDRLFCFEPLILTLAGLSKAKAKIEKIEDTVCIGN